MIVDTATQRDLDIGSSPIAGGPTLLGMIDRTWSRSGRERIRKELFAPHSVDEILALQRAHQALAAAYTSYHEILSRIDLDGAERYLTSTWQLPEQRRRLLRVVGRLLKPSWHREYLSDVRRGRTRILSVLAGAQELCRRMFDRDGSLLQTINIRLQALLDTAELQRLSALGTSRAPASLEAFDQLARERARPMVSELIDEIGRVEAMWSLAVATVQQGWRYPTPGSQLRVTGLRHPFLGERAVQYDLALADHVRVCFVTGPNMAGKSTFLKAIGAALVLAHCGCGVPADTMEFVPVTTIFSSVQIVENLVAGESFYLAEVRRIRALATALHAGRTAVALIDEPFRGTNVHDAVEATTAVICRLVKHPKATVFLASHLAEAVSGLASDPRISLLHFAADMSGEQPRFDYRLRSGLSTQRLGLALLKQEQVLDLLDRQSLDERSDKIVSI
jgi:DNA mismatch repair protein MutS